MKSLPWLGNNSKATAILRVASSPQDSDSAFREQESSVRGYAQRMGLDLPDEEIFRVVESGRDFRGSQRESLIHHASEKSIRHIIFFGREQMTRDLAFGDWDERLVLEDKIVIHFSRENCIICKGEGCIEISIGDRSEGGPS